MNPCKCACGCGKITPIAKYSDRRSGYVAGQPLRYLHGHNMRGKKRNHSKETRERMGASQLRRFENPENHPRWKGGITMHKGYVKIKVHGHPYASRHGYVKRSRLVAEKALGRYLKPHEIVHHRNEKKDDDRNKNLVICSKKYHDYLHMTMRLKEKHNETLHAN